MAGLSILIVGRRHSGKSSLLRSKLKNANKKALLILDVNNEHKDLYPYPMPSFDDFTEKCTKIKNGIIAIEEAMIYLSSRGRNTDIVEMLVKLRHNNNIVFFNFHSFSAIPKYIYDVSDYIYILKTNDNEAAIQSKFGSPELVEAFNTIKNAPLKTGSGGASYSPHLLFSING